MQQQRPAARTHDVDSSGWGKRLLWRQRDNGEADKPVTSSSHINDEKELLEKQQVMSGFHVRNQWGSCVLYIASIAVSVSGRCLQYNHFFFLIHDVEALLWKTFPGVHYFSNAGLREKICDISRSDHSDGSGSEGENWGGESPVCGSASGPLKHSACPGSWNVSVESHLLKKKKKKFWLTL